MIGYCLRTLHWRVCSKAQPIMTHSSRTLAVSPHHNTLWNGLSVGAVLQRRFPLGLSECHAVSSLKRVFTKSAQTIRSVRVSRIRTLEQSQKIQKIWCFVRNQKGLNLTAIIAFQFGRSLNRAAPAHTARFSFCIIETADCKLQNAKRLHRSVER